MAGKAQHPWKISPWLRRRRGLERLLQAEVVDDQYGIGISGSQPRGLIEASPRHEVHRQ